MCSTKGMFGVAAMLRRYIADEQAQAAALHHALDRGTYEAFCVSPRNALSKAFRWDCTPEGVAFWRDIYQSMPKMLCHEEVA